MTNPNRSIRKRAQTFQFSTFSLDSAVLLTISGVDSLPVAGIVMTLCVYGDSSCDIDRTKNDPKKYSRQKVSLLGAI